LLFTDWAFSFNLAQFKTFCTLGFIILDLRPPPSFGVIELFLSFIMRPFVAPRERVVLAELEPLFAMFITFCGICKVGLWPPLCDF
jgi:hypothetical protein